ncbi:fatty acyl-AMP ligase [Pajaroellobacter abortibovis]|uniref:AMP-dependent synthetase/ligase domain-containing protein n=1 Tax=Pajaroellobacter abortibovis TaxID=1882918 RepID=A0A1L6MVR0_9BACT|nr:fatty acyl-AMP ligase [Pajaroellobacter abortibovis]APR99633.1 hypothetical protein BCY86_02285 [Pajaroellobacter abortibovis]
MNIAPTLVDAIRALASEHRHGFTFLQSDGSESYYPFSLIYQQAECRAAHLIAHGIRKGERVALIVPEEDEFILSFLGAMIAGAVPVPIYPQLSFKGIETYYAIVGHILDACAPALVITTGAVKAILEPVLAQHSDAKAVITVNQFKESVGPFHTVDVQPSDLAFLQFTSGSTSRPKGVMVTHANLMANAYAFMVEGVHKDSSVDKGVSWLPLFHDMGLIGFVIGPLAVNIPVVFIPTSSFVRTPRLWLETLHKHRGTLTFAPNFAYALIAKRIREKDIAHMDLSCIRSAGCGAEPIQAKTLREFATLLAPTGFNPKALLPSYGMAEATLAITFSPLFLGLSVDEVSISSLQGGTPCPACQGDEETIEVVNCGKPFVGHEIGIVNEQGERLGDRQVGQVIVRGPSVTAGYYRHPESTQAAFRNGWLYTGDLGYTVDGSLFICGRMKDVIIIRGRNFYPSDIEWIISELPGIRRGNAVAIGVEVEGEEQLVVCVEALGGEQKGLIEAISSTITSAFGLTVHKVVLVAPGTLPRTSSGKSQRSKTKEMYLKGQLTTRDRCREGEDNQSV